MEETPRPIGVGAEDEIGGVDRAAQGGDGNGCCGRTAGTVGAGQHIRRSRTHGRHVMPGVGVGQSGVMVDMLWPACGSGWAGPEST